MPDRARALRLLLDALADGEPAPAAPGPPPGLPAGARWLSPLEADVVAALAGGGWLTAAELGEKLPRADSRLRFILTNLVERDVLESDQRQGYRLRGG